MRRDETGRATQGAPSRQALARSAPQVKSIQQVVGNRGTAQLLRSPGTDVATAGPDTPQRSGPPPARARQRARFFARLWSNGQAIAPPGETADGSGYAFEIYGFRQGATVQREPGSGAATGRRSYSDITFNKPIDEMSPLLLKALSENHVVRASFEIWRGDTLAQTIDVGNGRISSRELGVDAEGYDNEAVGISFQTINQTSPNGGVSHEDTWGAQR